MVVPRIDLAGGQARQRAGVRQFRQGGLAGKGHSWETR